MVGSRSAQTVAVCEGGIELAQVRSAFQIGEFVHDDVRVRGDDGRPNGPFVECVSDHRFGAEFPARIPPSKACASIRLQNGLREPAVEPAGVRRALVAAATK